MSALADWLACRAHLNRIDQGLVRAGLGRGDPVHWLIREVAVLPDRLGRLMAMVGLLLALSAGLVAAGVNWALAEPLVQVLPAQGRTGPVLVIAAPHGARWHACPGAGQLCLEILEASPTVVSSNQPNGVTHDH